MSSIRVNDWPPTCGVMITFVRSHSRLSGGERFDLGDVEPGTRQMARLDRVRQIVLDDQAAAGHVDQDRALAAAARAAAR